MLYTALFLATLASQATAQLRACNADNCARAVTGTVGTVPVFSKLADCSSFFRATVTPATVTSTVVVQTSVRVTSTVTVVVDTTSPAAGTGATGTGAAGTGAAGTGAAGTGATGTGAAGTGATGTGAAGTGTGTSISGTSIAGTGNAGAGTGTITPTAGRAGETTAAVAKRGAARLELALAPPASLAPRQVTVIPSAIPAYASACAGAFRYSSACSCFGARAATTTVAAPVTTVTTTATSTVVVNVNVPVCANHPYVFTGGYLNAPAGGSYVFNTAFFGITDPTLCCGQCWSTPGCLYNQIATVPNDDGTTTDGCRLIIASGATAATGVSAQCPLGIYEVVLSPGDYYGLGPCEVVVGTT